MKIKPLSKKRTKEVEFWMVIIALIIMISLIVCDTVIDNRTRLSGTTVMEADGWYRECQELETETRRETYYEVRGYDIDISDWVIFDVNTSWEAINYYEYFGRSGYIDIDITTFEKSIEVPISGMCKPGKEIWVR